MVIFQRAYSWKELADFLVAGIIHLQGGQAVKKMADSMIYILANTN
jgi:hypothetical protein